MIDDKTEKNEAGHSGLSDPDDEAIQFVARRYGLNRRDARKLVARVGNDRDRLNQEARKLTRTEKKGTVRQSLANLVREGDLGFPPIGRIISTAAKKGKTVDAPFSSGCLQTNQLSSRALSLAIRQARLRKSESRSGVRKSSSLQMCFARS